MKKLKDNFLQSSFLKVFNIMRKIKNFSLFNKAFHTLLTIKKNLNIYLYTIILDFIFLALIVFIGKYFGSLIPSDPKELIDVFKSSTSLLLFVLGYPIVYYLFVLFVYSVTKLSILNLIKSLYGKNFPKENLFLSSVKFKKILNFINYEKNRFTLKRLGKFYLLNIMLFVLFFFSALILLGILTLIFRRDFLNYVVLILLIVFLFFLYSIINISHTLFIKNGEKGIVRKSLDIAFGKINKYGVFIIWNSVVILAYLIFHNLILRSLIFVNKDLLVGYGGIYGKIFNVISLVIIYLIIAFNRIYFYERIGEDVLQ